MNNLDFNITLALFALGIGIVFASGIWFLITQWMKKRTVAKTRKEFESRIPLTIEEIEAERELTRAQHVHELRLMELKISELTLRNAESNLKTQTAMGRVSQLNDRVERLRLELAAARKRKKINVDNDE